MQILIIHGDYTVKSKDRLQDIIEKSKDKNWEIIRLEQQTNKSLLDSFTSKSLFADKVLYVLEDFKKMSGKELSWLSKNNNKLDGFLVIYNNSLINKTSLKKLPKGYKEEQFLLPKLIWKFFDSIYPKNSKNCLTLLHEVVKKEAAEFVFHLMARHIRDLYWVSIDPKAADFPSWRLAKLKKQASLFTKDGLKKLLNNLAILDIKVKTSKEDLIEGLDFTLASNLE